MVSQGDLPNPRDQASAPRLGVPFNIFPHCCIYRYNAENEIIGAECAPLGINFTANDCTRLVVDPANPDSPERQYGVLAECCRDCQLLEIKLILANCGNRKFLAGVAGRPYTSRAESPEDCCCGDVPRCVQVPDCQQVDCYLEPPDSGNKCDGRCLSMQYDEDGNELPEDRDLLCATKVQCCADDNTQCETRCYDTPPVQIPGAGFDHPPAVWRGPENQWTPMACTTGCGVCCTHVYNLDPDSPGYGESVMRIGNTELTQAECEAIFYDPNTLGPVLEPVEIGPVGDWIANTDDVNACNPPCCRDLQYGQATAAECYYTDQVACDPCIGRCVDVRAEDDPGKCRRDFCATKQECCGDGNERCLPNDCSVLPQYRWEEMACGTDGDKCGTCCKRLYSADASSVIGVECDALTTTKNDCERTVEIEVGGDVENVQYGTWYEFATCAACDPVPCCREITCDDGTTKTVCVEVAREDCDICNGRCTEIETGEQTCATKYECCGPNDQNCNPSCGNPPTHRWSLTHDDTSPICADLEDCGVCCRTVYSVNVATGVQTYVSHTCHAEGDYSTRSSCVLTSEEAATIPANQAVVYEWRPFAENCADVSCITKKCCGTICPGDVGCIDIDIDASCDPCKGRCFDKLHETSSCKTKQECCGANNELCTDCPPPGLEARFEWDGCFENGFKCGVCCQLTLNEDGDPVSSECLDDVTYNECIALPNASWKAFETCESAVCIPRACCNDELCPDQTVCIPVDKERGTCPDFCRDECYEIDEDGEQIAPSFCATKVDCCGVANELCEPQPAFCPDGSPSIPTYSWPHSGWPYNCADPELCGVCCKRIVAPGGAVSFECDSEVTDQTTCTTDDYGVWYPFATCAACGQTKQACVQGTCVKIVNGVEEQYTHAVCKTVPIDYPTDCEGICTEFATEERGYDVKTCKTKTDCCGEDGSKCAPDCGQTATHSWASTCTDPLQCGVCCIVSNIGDGNPTTTCQVDIGAEQCALLNTAGGGLGNTAEWIPFGTCRDCSVQRCCDTCPDGSIICRDVIPPEVCAQPCNGRCIPLDADGNPDPTQQPFCATKEECCMLGGVNVCASNCVRRWEPTCPENETKCGVACKTTLDSDGQRVLASICVPGITTYAQFLQAQANLLPNETLTWKPWDTCETVICKSKKCCKEKCPGVLGCVDVDVSDPCTSCEGLCYDAVVDPDTGAHSIAPGAQPQCSMRVDCCGAANEKCAEIPNCPQDNPKVFVPCCENDVFQLCQCGEGTETSNRYTFNSPLYQRTEPPIPGFPVGYDREDCNFRLDGYQPLGFLSALFQFKLWEAGRWGSNLGPDPSYENPCSGGGNVVPTFNWKECYPGLIEQLPGDPPSRVVYVFSQQRFGYGTISPSTGGGVPFLPAGEEVYHNLKEQRFRFYVCQGRQLVEITDAIINKLTVPGCITTTKQYQRRCVFEVFTFMAADADAFGLPDRPEAYTELTAIGLPGYYFNGVSTIFFGGWTAMRFRRVDAVYNDIVTGNVNLPPVAYDIYDRWGNLVFAQGSQRPIWQWYIHSDVSASVCGGGLPQSTTTYTQANIPDAFDTSLCGKQYVELSNLPLVPPSSFIASEDCCTIYENTEQTGFGVDCEHDWQVCGQLFDNGLPYPKAANCPQNFTANPLP